MNAKDFLFQKGITNDPQKGLFVKRDDMEFDIAQLMEEYRALGKPVVKSTSLNLVEYEPSLQTGWIHGSNYYPLSGLVPMVRDRKPGIMTLNGPAEVNKGDYLLMNTAGKVIEVVSEREALEHYN